MIDPVTFEVIRNALVAATDEMALALKRSAYSTNIKTRSDFSCAFFDADLRAVAQGFAQPVHLGSMVEQVPKAVLEYGPERLAPGAVSSNLLIHADGSEEVLPSMFSITIQPDDVYVHRTAGGGGWGDPAARDPERREADVADGKVSA